MECPVCWEDVHPVKLFSLACGHGVCLRCWREHLVTAVQSQGRACVSLRCPAAPCAQVVDEDTWALLCPPWQLARYRQFLLESFVEGSLHLRFCSNPRGCPLAIRYTGPKRDVVCACGHRMCFACSADAHWPLPCAMMEAWRRRADADGAAAHWLLGNTKRCPRCRVHIEKNEGCLHMTCSHCGHQFCWNCKRPWSSHGADTGGYFRCNLYDPERHVERYDDLPRAAGGVAARAARRLQRGGGDGADDSSARDASLHRYMHFLHRYETQERAVERLTRLQRHARTAHDRVQPVLESAVGASGGGAGAAGSFVGSLFGPSSPLRRSPASAGAAGAAEAASTEHGSRGEDILARLRRTVLGLREGRADAGARVGARGREGAARGLSTRELAWTAAAAERVSEAAASLTECFSVLKNSFIFLFFLPDDVRASEGVGSWERRSCCAPTHSLMCCIHTHAPPHRVSLLPLSHMHAHTHTTLVATAGAVAAAAGVPPERPRVAVRAGLGNAARCRAVGVDRGYAAAPHLRRTSPHRLRSPGVRACSQHRTALRCDVLTGVRAFPLSRSPQGLLRCTGAPRRQFRGRRGRLRVARRDCGGGGEGRGCGAVGPCHSVQPPAGR